MSRSTKIVATLGPACDGPAVLDGMVQAGMDVARLNLSHGELAEHLDRMARVRDAAARAGRPVGVLADLPGPKIRSGAFPQGGVALLPGSSVRLVPGDSTSDAGRVTVGYPTLLEDIDAGDRVVLGDGNVSLRVTAVGSEEVLAEVESGGRVQGRPGVHLSCERLRMRAPTETDLRLARVVVDAGVEYLALSFVRRAADVDAVRDVVGDRVLIVSKIETSEAVADLDAIAARSDGLMVARGDLGIDFPLEDVPHLQKEIIAHCVATGTPVITATQMLESMIYAPTPTRAEVSDVANAVLDGSDALMLSGETAIGHDPVAVVSTMSRVASRSERSAGYRRWAERRGRTSLDQLDDVDIADRITASVTHAAWQAARDCGASAILCCTRSGRTARAMARFRPAARLIGLSPYPRTVNALTLSWGVESLLVEEYHTSEEMVWFAVETAVQHGLVTHGDLVLVLAGAPDQHSGAATDVLRIVQVT